MIYLARVAVFLVCLVAVGLSTGCKKSGEDTSVIEGAAALPGATNIWVAIEKKNYDGAMAALFKVRDACTTPEQSIQFMVLSRQVRDKLSEAGATSPAAAEAARALRALATGGR